MKNQKNNQIDRRTFLGHSAKIAAAGLVLNKLSAATKKYVSFAGEIKVALVGCGGRGTGAAGQAIAADRDVRLVAVADVFADRAQQCLLSLAEKYSDSEQLAVTEDAVFHWL
jgi:predicted homoserine dehydrogenase-like protein